MKRMKIGMYGFLMTFVLSAILSGCRHSTGGEPVKDLVLTFNENHQFKIAQFTDIHWKNG
jgi:hypothetical protein